MRRMLVALVLAAAAAPAQAQIAAAIGKPLPSADMAPGQLSVRIVAGSPSSPVVGTEVTLLVNGAPRIARTDSAGRAFFKDLPAGAQLQAKVVDEDKKEVASETFQLPADSGARLMLTTRKWEPGAAAGAGPMAGGGMPEPRQMSGEPRPEQGDPPGTMTVRLTYDDFKDAPPVGVPVQLIGYDANFGVTYAMKSTDKEGRARFEGLDRSGATAYFAMTLLPQGQGVDRLISTPATLDARTGVRLILSGAKRSVTEPVDDLAKLEKQDNAPPAGKVMITLEGGPEPGGVVTLVDAATKHEIGRGKAEAGAPDPSEVQAGAQFDPKPDIAAGMVRVHVHGGAMGTDQPLPDIGVRLIAASAKDAGSDDAEHKTNDSGIVELATALKEPVTAVVSLNGRQMRSPPLDVTKSGGELEVQARWPSSGKQQAMFDLIPRVGQIVYAETTMHGKQYRSLPFQPLADRGTRVSLFIFPRVLFTFSLTSRIDDAYFAVNGRFEVSNNSWAPYVGGPDGLIVPLPRGFKGGIVADKDQGDVAISPGEGFRIVRPIAPGTRTFHGAFSLPVEDGTVTWSLDLPFGAFNSGMDILQVPGMNVNPPDGVEHRTQDVPQQGSFYVLPQISILPNQSMVMTITGLPSAPAWRKWVPRIVGIAVVLVILAGLYFAFGRRPKVAAQDRRQQLLDELVELEKSGKREKRREQIMSELEQLWDDAG